MEKRKLTRIAFLIAGLSLVASVLTLFIPVPANSDTAAIRVLLWISSAMIVTHIGGAALFVAGLKGFSQSLKHAYAWLVAGFVLLALSFVQLPILALFDLEKNMWAASTVAISFLVCVIFLYIGARGFARLFGVRSVLISGFKATTLAMLVSAVAMLLPHGTPNVEMDQATIIVMKFMIALPSVLITWAMYLAFRARARANALYVPAMAWLAVYFTLDFACSTSVASMYYVQLGENAVINSGLLYIPYIIAGFVLIKAGYEFNKVRFAGADAAAVAKQTFFGSSLGRNNDQQAQGSLSDVLIYAAGFASDVKSIDLILDDLRVITATMQRDAPVTPELQKQLAGIYLHIEQYLAVQEKVRPTSPEVLRTAVRARFAPVIASHEAFAQMSGLGASPVQPVSDIASGAANPN